MAVIRHVEPPGRASTDESIIPPATPVIRESFIPRHLRLVSFYELRAILICGFGASDRIMSRADASRCPGSQVRLAGLGNSPSSASLATSRSIPRAPSQDCRHEMRTPREVISSAHSEAGCRIITGRQGAMPRPRGQISVTVSSHFGNRSIRSGCDRNRSLPRP